MRRSFVLVALLALPACGSTDPGAPAPDAGLPCTGPDPSAPGCDSQCSDPIVCGCGAYVCDPSTGQWKVGTVCECPPVWVAGKWTLAQVLVGDDPCPGVIHPDHQVLLAESGPAGWKVSRADGGPAATMVMVSQNPGLSTVSFALDEVWKADGDIAYAARTTYELGFDTEGQINGQATATATLGDSTCTYHFDVIGTRTP